MTASFAMAAMPPGSSRTPDLVQCPAPISLTKSCSPTRQGFLDAPGVHTILDLEVTYGSAGFGRFRVSKRRSHGEDCNQDHLHEDRGSKERAHQDGCLQGVIQGCCG